MAFLFYSPINTIVDVSIVNQNNHFLILNVANQLRGLGKYNSRQIMEGNLAKEIPELFLLKEGWSPLIIYCECLWRKYIMTSLGGTNPCEIIYVLYI